jgi:hypothetical protein
MNKELCFVVTLHDQSFTVDDTHKAGNIRNEVEGNGFPRIHARTSALCGICRIEHLKEQTSSQRCTIYPLSCCTTYLDGIISTLDLSDAIPPPNEKKKTSLEKPKKKIHMKKKVRTLHRREP